MNSFIESIRNRSFANRMIAVPNDLTVDYKLNQLDQEYTAPVLNRAMLKHNDIACISYAAGVLFVIMIAIYFIWPYEMYNWLTLTVFVVLLFGLSSSVIFICRVSRDLCALSFNCMVVIT